MKRHLPLAFSAAMNVLLVIALAILCRTPGTLHATRVMLFGNRHPGVESLPSYRVDVRRFIESPNPQADFLFLGDSQTHGLLVTAAHDELVGDGIWNDDVIRRIRDRSINGETIEGLTVRLPEAMRCHPKKIFLMIGVNDLLEGHAAERAIRDYRELLGAIRKDFQGQVFVQTIPPVSRVGERAWCSNRGISEVNAALKTLPGVTVIDLHAEFADPGGKLPDEQTEDGLHLSARGIRRWETILSHFLRSQSDADADRHGGRGSGVRSVVTVD